MKKQLLSTLTLLLFSIFSYSQITLENTIITKNREFYFLKIDDNTTKYFVFDREELKLKMYNSNHSIYKIIEVNINDFSFTPTSDTLISAVCVSQKVFDNDSGIEFMLEVADFRSDNYETLIINDDGNSIFKKANQLPLETEYGLTQPPVSIKNTENGIKMILKSTINDEKYIYGLPGNEVLKSAQIDSKKIKLKAFPNPSSEFINLDYELPFGIETGKILIYNLNGKKIKEFEIDNHVTSLKLSNRDLSSGTYIYSIIAENLKSKPLKVIIK